ncbi:MAG: DUF2779 domain-containing protein [Acidobacteriota bacterium]|jgi:hypothetical protein
MAEKKQLLTKSAFLLGLQCDKLLWMYQNQRELMPEVDETTQAIFRQGHRVGDLAKTLYPDGIEIDWSAGHEQGIAQTRAALRQRKPLFEAGFVHGRLHARADILKPAANGRWDLIEVKSSSKVKEEHIPDVAFQKQVYEGAGIRIHRCYLMHVDTSYVRDGEVDPEGLLQRTEVTDEVTASADVVRSEAKRMIAVMSAKKCPEVPVGSHCAECALYGDCWAFLPERHVFSLTYGGQKCYELMDQGILKVRDIPDDFPLREKQAIQVACEKSRKPHMRLEKIEEFLGSLAYPLYFLDFETFMAAVPPYDRMSPYEVIPFQFSLHVLEALGKSGKHHSYLADGSGDPRPELLGMLKKLIGRTGSIVAFNASYETRILYLCSRRFSEFAGWIESLRPRFVDLHVPFWQLDYYHPDQQGSTSLKAVLPAMTKLRYDDLEIGDGQTASLRFAEMAFGDVTPAAKQDIRAALETYCHQDTEGMVEIVKALQRLCG